MRHGKWFVVGLLLSLLLFGSLAYGDGRHRKPDPKATATSKSESSARATSISAAGASAGATATAPAEVSQNVTNERSAPSVFVAPAGLTTGVYSCMGSYSTGLGIGVPPFSVAGGVGKTYKDPDCNRRAYATFLHAAGHKSAALSLLALDPEVAKALEATGVKYVKIAPKEEEKVAEVEKTPQPKPGSWEAEAKGFREPGR